MLLFSSSKITDQAPKIFDTKELNILTPELIGQNVSSQVFFTSKVQFTTLVQSSILVQCTVLLYCDFIIPFLSV